MHKQLTFEQRHYINIARKNDKSMRTIAKDLNVSHTTISREIKRNSGERGYRFNQADVFAQQRHQSKAKFVKLGADTKKIINNCLKLDWSPEQVCGWLDVNNIVKLHHESIYRYLLKDKASGGLLYKHLRHQGKPYRKRYGYPNNRTGIPDRVDIDQRPEAVNNRQVFGHWEADTIIGKAHKGAIVTLDERISRLRLAYPVNSKHKDGVSDAINALFDPIKNFVHSITYDNGKEFAGHEQVNKTIDCRSYFAKPYHSWERGQNENANGLLRQYFPKSMKLIDIAIDDVKIAVDKLNSRPRKCLGFKTPYQVFLEETGINARQLEVVRL
jgi:IS30 family transposase